MIGDGWIVLAISLGVVLSLACGVLAWLYPSSPLQAPMILLAIAYSFSAGRFYGLLRSLRR